MIKTQKSWKCAAPFMLPIKHHLEATFGQIFALWKTLLPKSAGGPFSVPPTHKQWVQEHAVCIH